jgi:hypothetical protein
MVTPRANHGPRLEDELMLQTRPFRGMVDARDVDWGRQLAAARGGGRGRGTFRLCGSVETSAGAGRFWLDVFGEEKVGRRRSSLGGWRRLT